MRLWRYATMAPFHVRMFVLTVAIALLIVAVYTGKSLLYPIPGLLLGTFVLGDRALFGRRRAKRLEAELEAIQYRRCPNCLYDLHGSYPQGRCPECGEPYDWAELPSRWTSILNHLR